MIDVSQLTELIIEPVTKHLQLYSEQATELLVGTATAESSLTYLKQLGGGPAVGIWQMEPMTHNDIWANYLAYREGLADRVRSFSFDEGEIPNANQMIGNLWYACAMARVHYLRVPEPLPRAGDNLGQAQYWKAYYNTSAGAGTVEHYTAAIAHV